MKCFPRLAVSVFFFPQLIFIYHYTGFEDQIAALAVGSQWFFSLNLLFIYHYTGFEDQIAAFVDAEVARTLAAAERQSYIFYYGSLTLLL